MLRCNQGTHFLPFYQQLATKFSPLAKHKTSPVDSSIDSTTGVIELLASPTTAL
jgi:hypothetical protein